jgi:phosphatidylglycerophosphate synthase
MHKLSYYLINSITMYRLISAPILVALIVIGQIHIFKWFLFISFGTDAIDGYLARKYKVASLFGAWLDSIADDLTVAAGIIGLFYFSPFFIQEQLRIFLVVFGLFLIQIVMAVVRYGRPTSFHTYLAKLAALLQGVFLILAFFMGPIVSLFYVAAFITAIEIIEEIILIQILPQWQANVKGVFWLMK